MVRLIYTETKEQIKAFDSEEQALDWMGEHCSITLAWLTGAAEGKAYYNGKSVDLEVIA